MRCKSRVFLLIPATVRSLLFLVTLLSLSFANRASASFALEVGYSAELLSVTAGSEDGEKSFSLVRPLGFQLGGDWGTLADRLHPIASLQVQVPGSLSRFESTKGIVGGRYYFGTPNVSASDDRSPFVMQSKSTIMWFGQVFVAYQRLFYVTLDKDGQPLSFDRAAAGIGVGGGVDYFPSWLGRSPSPWRFADDGRMRLRGVIDLSTSLLSFGFYPTTLQSLSFKILLVKPL